MNALSPSGLKHDDRTGRPFDGIICIGGEDWWYHNRGHFDFQIMTRLAGRAPVLFVNSIAVRVPSLGDGRQFVGKIRRKMSSIARGLVEAKPNFFVLSPVGLPGGMGRTLNAQLLAAQIRHAARRAGIRRPLLWVHCPAGASLIDHIPHTALVLQRTDRFEAFPEADPTRVGAQIATLKRRADLAIYCNRALMQEEAGAVASQVFVQHGVDVDRFIAAGSAVVAPPADLAAIARPRVGFIGGIDAHTFGIDLFRDTVARLPHVQFAMIGACSLPEGWCPADNVHFLGRKPYDEVAAYMAGMDVLIMPWNDSAWIQASNPIKLKEYLAVGRPIVTADFPALDPYRDLVRTADNADDFAAQLAEALSTPHDPEIGRRRIAGEDWDSKAAAVWDALVVAASHRASGHGVTARPLSDAA